LQFASVILLQLKEFFPSLFAAFTTAPGSADRSSLCCYGLRPTDKTIRYNMVRSLAFAFEFV